MDLKSAHACSERAERFDHSQPAAFIVGAPRCGTTTLSHMFRQHPAVCFARPKEPHFFSRFDLRSAELPELIGIIEKNYLDRFFEGAKNGSLLMEASPTYLYTPEHLLPILKLWPQARFVIALREPVAMVSSLHSRLLVTGDENVRDFDRAWRLIGPRSLGKDLPTSCVEPRWLRYDRAAAYGSHVKAFWEVIGRDRCSVVLLEDLSADPHSVYNDLCRFIGLDPWPGTKFELRRTNRTIRSLWLQRLLNRPPIAFTRFLAGEMALVREGHSSPRGMKQAGLAKRVRRRLLDWNETTTTRNELSFEMRREIVEHYRPEIEELQALLHRDLSHWLEIT